MPDDILRMRATVVSDEALANIRAIGREIGLMPRNAGKGIEQVNKQFSVLGDTIHGAGKQLLGAVPMLRSFGFGAGSAVAAMTAVVYTASGVAKKMVELRYASKELGMTQQDLRGWSVAAQKAGIAPESMSAGLATFKRNTEDFKLRIGDVRQQMMALGAGPVLARINAATTQLDKMKEAYDFKDELDRADPSGVKARRFFDMIGLGAQAARLSYEEFIDAKNKEPIISEEDERRAKKFNDQMVELGATWDHLVERFGVATFPALTTGISLLNEFFDKADKYEAWTKRPAGNTDIINPNSLTGKVIKSVTDTIDDSSGTSTPKSIRRKGSVQWKPGTGLTGPLPPAVPASPSLKGLHPDKSSGLSLPGDDHTPPAWMTGAKAGEYAAWAAQVGLPARGHNSPGDCRDRTGRRDPHHQRHRWRCGDISGDAQACPGMVRPDHAQAARRALGSTANQEAVGRGRGAPGRGGGPSNPVEAILAGGQAVRQP